MPSTQNRAVNERDSHSCPHQAKSSKDCSLLFAEVQLPMLFHC